jgi:hypothetical protein
MLQMEFKLILIHNIFEIFFLKAFLCCKQNFKVPKESKKKIYIIFFFSGGCVIGKSVYFGGKTGMQAEGERSFLKNLQNRAITKKVFYWDIALEIRMFNIHNSLALLRIITCERRLFDFLVIHFQDKMT